MTWRVTIKIGGPNEVPIYGSTFHDSFTGAQEQAGIWSKGLGPGEWVRIERGDTNSGQDQQDEG